jgi:hypothetical protein
MDSIWRELSMGIGVAVVVSVVVQGAEPFLSVLSPLLVMPAILLALGLVWTVPRLRPVLVGAAVPAAVVTGLLINYGPYPGPSPGASLGARVSFYAQLAYYKSELDAQCARATGCHDPSQVTTIITEGFGSFIQGLARDDSGALIIAREHNWPAPSPLTGCEYGIVHLYGSYWHFGCG